MASLNVASVGQLHKRKSGLDHVRKDQTEKRMRTEEDEQGSLDRLAELLDFSEAASENLIECRARELSAALLNEFVLVLTRGKMQTKFDILELEFYLTKPEIHEDPFTHGSDEQSQSGRWYFHRAPSKSGIGNSERKATAAGGYRGGSRKGLDLTLGGPVTSPHFSASVSMQAFSQVRGGALLRSLRCVSDSRVISGPSLIVDEILRLSKAESIFELVDKKWRGDIRAFPPKSTGENHVSLSIQPKVSEHVVYSSPRIGLDLSHPHAFSSPANPRVLYLAKHYRFFTRPHLLTSNGRCQTFLGVYYRIAPTYTSQDQDDALPTEIAKASGIKVQTAANYIDQYRSGYDGESVSSFVGRKGASASPTTYLSMMGAVDRMLHDHASELK